MAIQSQPSRIPEPFAGSGTKNTIPATNSTPSASQAASWASGFPPECSQPISAGGCPVPRNDVNGALNQLSQDFAFRQDGGIWEWSALADYDTQRMVRGSDGLLYWSVAQNGPSFASGAVDPTIDDGTYWSSPALKTMPLADKSAMGATTEWVKDLAVAPVYLDPAGSDSNDGMTAVTAVQTFARAISIVESLQHAKSTIIVASGSYSGNAVFSGLKTIVEISGNVSFSGRFEVSQNSAVVVTSSDNDNTTLTFNFTSTNDAVVSKANSSLAISCKLVINASNNELCIRSGVSSSIITYKTVDINVNYSGVAISVDGISGLYALGKITISGISAKEGISVNGGSRIFIYDGLSIPSFILDQRCIRCSQSSSLYIDGSSVIYSNKGSSYTKSCIVAQDSSSVYVSGNCEFHIYSGGYCAIIAQSSCCTLNGTISYEATQAVNLFNVVQNSTLFVDGTNSFSGSTVTSSGFNGNIVYINRQSSASFQGTCTGSVDNASKYFIIFNSSGFLVSTLPGSAGTIDSSSIAS